MKQLLCQKCKQKEAVVRVTKIENGQATQMNLCKECAQQFHNAKILPGLVSDFMQALFTLKGAPNSQQAAARCPVCGLTFAQIQQAGRAGCHHCYETFEPQMDFLLRRLHGGSRHAGKVPRRGGCSIRRQNEVRSLKTELQELVQREAFEEAALLRDRIRELETVRGGESE
ncbi:MAG: UvrB/UvrC motif-containing protein [Gracilibacteraceae bacterium]|nr:UvrB/UvrC motif-containing protein [Gracilibacteraceae bacterium]